MWTRFIRAMRALPLLPLLMQNMKSEYISFSAFWWWAKQMLRWYTAVISHNAHNVALFLCFNISFAFCALRCAVDASVCDDNRFDIYFPRIFMHTINGKWLFWFDGGCCYWDHRDTKRLLWTKGKFTYQTRIKMKCILIYSVLTWSKQASKRTKKEAVLLYVRCTLWNFRAP